MLDADREFGEQVEQYVEELEAMVEEQYDPNLFFTALTNALRQLESLGAEAA